LGAQCLWRPADLGLRPGYESETMKRYLAGDLVDTGDGTKVGKV
jgi:nitrate reductase alpha subunit